MRKFLALFAAIALMSGCMKQDLDDIRKDVDDLKSRVEKLEAWCATANGQISALQGLVEALENKDFVTSVTPLMENNKVAGYTITFTKSDPITIRNGVDGEAQAPVVGVKKDIDGKYYWTVKVGSAPAEWLLDDAGKKIPTTGEAPEIGVAAFEGVLYWQMDGEWMLQDGKKVPVTGEQGDSIFAEDGIDYQTDPDNVTFTLADGVTTITLPRSSEIFVGFDKYDTFYCAPNANEISLLLPTKMKADDYTSLVATIISNEGTSTDIQTRAISNDEGKWGVKITKPTFAADGIVEAGSAKVTITIPQNVTYYKALLKVTIVDKKGQEHSATRPVWYSTGNVVANTAGSLSANITDPTAVTKLTVTGEVDAADFQYMRENLTSMEVLDLSRSTLVSLPEKAMAFYSNMGLPVNTSLKTVILPETLTTIGNSAFAMCTNLQEINIPASVRTLGRWMFEGCSQLSRVELPEGITGIPDSAFYGATGLETITIPTSVTTLGKWAFEGCSNLSSVNIKAQVSVISGSMFTNCVKLAEIDLPSSITTIEGNAFAGTGFTQFTIPSNVTTIGEGAFSSCGNLENVAIPGNITMSFSLFAYCPKLKNVTLSEGLTEIGAETFRDCTSLQNIVLPSSVTTIRDRAFQGCTSLSTLTCKATTAPALAPHNMGENYNLHFYNLPSNCILKRPNGANYSAWSSYFGGGIQNL